MSLLSQPILSCRDAVEAEKSFLGDDPFKVSAAMEAAGSGIAHGILRDWQEIGEFPDWARILVLAGKGHNAGDALIAANHILAHKPHALLSVLWVDGSDQLKPATRDAAETCRQTGQMEEFSVSPQTLKELAGREWDLVIDGILGMNFSPPLRPHTAEVLRWANEDLAPRVAFRAAVDLPSGWGDLKGGTAFVADFTYMTGLAKAPAFEPGAIAHTGRVRLVRIPLFELDDDVAHAMVLPGAHRILRRLRASDSDKRSYGHVLILAGSLHMPGAAIMSTLGAIHAGSGLTTTFSPANVAPRVASAVPEAMWQPVPVNHEGSLEPEVLRALHTASESGRALLIGPGLKMDRHSQFIISRIVREITLPIVIDASALTADSIAAVLSRPLHAGPVIITPHLGEYRRITGQPEAEYDAEAARAFCRKYHLTMVLKGPITRICNGERILEVTSGGPVLARGGSGDILAGMLLTGLSQEPDSPMEVAARAVSWHGAAADWLARKSGSVAVRTTDLLEGLAPSLRAPMHE